MRRLPPGEAQAARHAFALRLLRSGEAPDDVTHALRGEFRMSQASSGRLVAELLRRMARGVA